MAVRFAFLLAALTLFVGCGEPSTSPLDAGTYPDATASLDAGGSEDASIDAAHDAGAPDAGAPDAGPPVEGTITGSCDQIDTELFETTPSLFANEITFPLRLMEADLVHFTDGAQDLLATGTVGGSSIYSEAMAFEVLARCEGAELLAGEPDIDYLDENGTRTDILVVIDGERVGVSVARAMMFPRDAPYPASEAERILTNKLNDIQQSSLNVQEHHRWVKQILHVMAYGPMHGELIRSTWESLPDEVRADTILVVTVTHGEDAFIYDNEL